MKGFGHMVDQTPEFELSPLDQIRQTEAEVTRRIAAAREMAEQRVDQARKETASMVARAREAGLREGQVRYQEIILEAKEEAKQFEVNAQRQSEEIRLRGEQRMEQAVQQVVSIVIGLEDDMENE
jgi:vacuolar-type H+-ATPase subunit H